MKRAVKLGALGYLVLVLVIGGGVAALTHGPTTSKEKQKVAEKQKMERAARALEALPPVDQVAREVEGIRDLTFDGPVPQVQVVDEMQLTQQLMMADMQLQTRTGSGQAQMMADQTAAQLFLSQAAIAPAMELKTAMTQADYKERYGAFLPGMGKILLNKDVIDQDRDQGELVLAAELSKALDEDRFGVVPRRAIPLQDPENAQAALREGTASLTAARYAIEQQDEEQPVDPTLADLRLRNVDPAKTPALRVYDAFPFDQGARYVEALFDQGDMEAVNTAHRDEPNSTHTVLHPGSGRGTNAVEPPSLVADRVLGDAFKPIGSGDIGELDTIAMLIESPDDRQSVRLAGEWRAGRWATFGGPQAVTCPPPCRKQSASVAVWQWSGEDAARRFVGAMSRQLQGRGAQREGGRSWTMEDGGAALVREGARTALTFAPDAPGAGRLAKAMLEQSPSAT